MRCQRQIFDVCWWAHVSNAQVLQRSSLTSYVIDSYLCLAVLRLDPRVPAHDALRLTVDIPTKAERLEPGHGSPDHWVNEPAGEDRRVALATSGSTRFRKMPTLYYYLRYGDLRSPGVTERIDHNSDFFTLQR